MEIVNNARSFLNLEDWLEGFSCDKGLEMRKGRLDALMNNENFDDRSELSKFKAANSRVWFICVAISLPNVKKSTIEYGVDLIFRVLYSPSYQWPRGVRKRTILRFLSLLRKFNIPNVKSLEMNYDLKLDFFRTLLCNYTPVKNSNKENEEIIETVFAVGCDGMFTCSSYWTGHDGVIAMFMDEVKDMPNPFSRTSGRGHRLAIHMAAAGDLDVALKRRRAEKRLK